MGTAGALRRVVVTALLVAAVTGGAVANATVSTTDVREGVCAVERADTDREKFHAAVDDGDGLAVEPRMLNASEGDWFDVRDDDLAKLVLAEVAGCEGLS